MSNDYSNPIDHFTNWYQHACECKHIEEANAMNLATTSANGVPTSRMVLLKTFDESGFIFYTNLGSRKGQQLSANPFAALCFYWEPLARQVRIEGRVTAVDDKQADEYFSTRPFKSKIGAWSSKQSQPLDHQKTLLKEIARQTVKYATKNVPRPSFWSGFCLIPIRVEFWQRGEYRIHQRQCYLLDESGQWKMQLLYP